MSRIVRYLLILIYYMIRPLLGPAQCKFSLSCGHYAMKQLKEQPLFHALRAICTRVWRCSPWGHWV